MPRFLSISLCVLLVLEPCLARKNKVSTWTFAVSGDSRNCGNVVMPAIAESAKRDGARFYWHLGDFRWMTNIDEDIRNQYGPGLNVDEYRQLAWGNFLANQIAPFAPLPVYLGIGNHELYGGKTKTDFIHQFSYWLDRPEIREQRLSECSEDCAVKTYYHWNTGHIDFIYLDNSTDKGFDDTQVKWFESVLEKDRSDNNIYTIVAAMHRALPNSLACSHSMNGDPDTPPAIAEESTNSGRRVYRDLVDWKKETNKKVYVLASHSHFFMQDIFATDYWKNPKNGGTILPGWIVGTAGAKRYRLPDLTLEQQKLANARTRVSGYLLGTVYPNGEIRFVFRDVRFSDTNFPVDVEKTFGTEFVKECFISNYDGTPHPVPSSCKDTE